MKPMDSGRPRFSTEEAQALALEMWSHKGIGQELLSERERRIPPEPILRDPSF